MLILAAALLVVLGWWTYFQTSGRTSDGRQEIVAWGITFFGEDVYKMLHPSIQAKFKEMKLSADGWKYTNRQTGQLYKVYMQADSVK